MRPDIIKIQKFLKSNSGWIAFFLLLFLTATCGVDKANQLVIKERESQNKIFQKEKDSLAKLVKDRDKIIAANDKKIAENQKELSKVKKDLANSLKKIEKQKAKQKNYNLNDWKDYFQDVTGYGDQDIYVDGNGLKMTREPLVAIGNELIQQDVVEAKLTATTRELMLAKSDFLLMRNNYEQEVEKNRLAKESAERDKDINNNLQKNVSDLKDQLKQASRPKLVPIIISAAAGLGAGILIAK